MNKTTVTLLFSLIGLSIEAINSNAINRNWKKAQQEYSQVNSSVRTDIEDATFFHPHWLNARKKIKRLIQGRARKDFIKAPEISGSMVREQNVKGILQEYELCYLQYCVNPEIKDLIHSYKDTDFTGIKFDCSTLQCSNTTLGHLFYTAKILQKSGTKNIKVITEFGSGYGNLARIFKTLLPNTTIALIDLPEFLALQYFFLTSTLPDTKIIMHAKAPQYLEENAIHLIPVFLIEELNINTDIFVSTFALSEAPEYVQKLITQKKFFNASTCYLTGQLNGWGTNFNFAHHATIHNAIRNQYKSVECLPFHLLSNNIESYELIGTLN